MKRKKYVSPGFTVVPVEEELPLCLSGYDTEIDKNNPDVGIDDSRINDWGDLW